MKLIPNWRTAHHYHTIWAAAALAAFDALSLALPGVHVFIGDRLFAFINLASAVAIAALRVQQQQSPPVTAEVKEKMIARVLSLPVANKGEGK